MSIAIYPLAGDVVLETQSEEGFTVRMTLDPTSARETSRALVAAADVAEVSVPEVDPAALPS